MLNAAHRLLAAQKTSPVKESGSIRGHLTSLGYKLIGHGTDASVWSDPGDPHSVLKIMDAADADATLDWYKFIESNPSKFFPKVLGHEKFTFAGKPYIQARLEKLEEISGSQSKSIRKWYDSLKPADFKKATSIKTFQDAVLVATLQGDKKNWRVDLEDDEDETKMRNIMKRGSTLVVADPWVDW